MEITHNNDAILADIDMSIIYNINNDGDISDMAINDINYNFMNNTLTNNNNPPHVYYFGTYNTDVDFIPFDNSSHQVHGIQVSVSSFNTSEEDRYCCVCMEETTAENICQLNCQHKFCIECIKQYIGTTRSNCSCPICRSNISTIKVKNNDSRDTFNL